MRKSSAAVDPVPSNWISSPTQICSGTVSTAPSMVVTTLASGRWQGSSQMTSAVQFELSVASDVNCQVMHPEALVTSSIWLQMSWPCRSKPV